MSGSEVTDPPRLLFVTGRRKDLIIMAACKRFRQVVFLPSLSATSTGKIMRRKLAGTHQAPALARRWRTPRATTEPPRQCWRADADRSWRRTARRSGPVRPSM